MTSKQGTLVLGSPEELEWRLTLVNPADTARGYFFNCALNQVRLHADAEALKRCTELLGEEKITPFFNYPITTLLRLLYNATWSLSEKHEGFEKTLQHLGRQVAQDFLSNAVGKTLLLLTGKAPTQLVNSLPSAYRTGWHHGQGAVKWTSPRQCIASIHGNVIPYPYFEGVFQQVFGAMGVVNMQVKGRQVEPVTSEYAFSWN